MIAIGEMARGDGKLLKRRFGELPLQQGEVASHRGRVVFADAEKEPGRERRNRSTEAACLAEQRAVGPPD